MKNELASRLPKYTLRVPRNSPFTAAFEEHKNVVVLECPRRINKESFRTFHVKAFTNIEGVYLYVERRKRE